MRSTATTLILAVLFATAGNAQELTAAMSGYQPLGLDDLDGELPVSAELRVTMPISDRFAIEPFVTGGKDDRRVRAGLEGFYGVQIRQRILRFSNTYAFATYGVAGYYSRSGYEGPLIGHFGFGLKQRVAKYLAFRPEVHLVTYHVVPIGARFVAGLSVGTGP